MTATHVNGVEVVATEPVDSPLSTPENRIQFTRIVKLLLANDSEVHGCTECTFTAVRVGSVRSHLGQAHPSARANGRRGQHPEPPTNGHAPDVNAMTIGELLNTGTQVAALTVALERLANDRDDWKARAKAAEKRLNAMRNALGTLS